MLGKSSLLTISPEKEKSHLLSNSKTIYESIISIKENYKGLCETCKNVKTCTCQKYEEGVWHCKYYIESD